MLLLSANATLGQTAPNPIQFEFKAKLINKDKIPYRGINLCFTGDKLSRCEVTDEIGNLTVKLPAGSYEAVVNRGISESFKAFILITEKGPNASDVEFVIEQNQTWCLNCTKGTQPNILLHTTPVYPPAARAVGARGDVTVLVKVDSSGNVISAKEVNGHPLLRAAARTVAKSWLFSPDDTIEERVCLIVFAFVSDSTKKIKSSFQPPNRLEVYSELRTIDSTLR